MNVKEVVVEEIVIVGGGVAGLATSLALHRKGIRSVVLERADLLRITGSNINIYTNGWRALKQLGVDAKLRSTAIRIHLRRDIFLDDHFEERTPSGKEEIRCVKRIDLVQTLANELPIGTIHFGHHIVGIYSDPNNSDPILQLNNGRIIKPKIVIGCDGVNSVISKYLDLKPPMFHSFGSLRGFTNYADGHGFDSEFVHIKKGKTLVGRVPMNEKLVFWFIALQWHQEYENISKDPTSMHVSALQAIKDFPSEIMEMVRKCEINSLSLFRTRYRPLREVAFNSFRKGNVTVAGDAMHVMGPYFGQGGCAALEDAVILARCMAREMCVVGSKDYKASQMSLMWGRARVAFDKYVKERRLRLLTLGLRARIIGKLEDPSPSRLVRFVCIVLMILFFRDANGPAQYDCGKL